MNTLHSIVLEIQPSYSLPINTHRQLHGKNGYIYYIRLTLPCNTTYYKIGFTSRDVEERIRKMWPPLNIKVDIVDRLYFDTLYDAFTIEQILHKTNKLNKYKGKDVINNGNKELYINDTLNIDNETKTKVAPAIKKYPRWKL